jgi:hypothetical protein
MNTELQQRKKAVQLYYYQNLSKADICRRLSCSRPWLDRWLNRYNPDAVENSLQDRKRGPHQGSSRWPKAIRQQVLDMRRMRSQRDQWPYALKGAAAIHYELQALHLPDVPPVRTIHSWLVNAELVPPRQGVQTAREHPPFPEPHADTVNVIQQLDLKGPLYLHGSSDKHYLAVLRDRYSHRCAIELLHNREALSIVDFLVASWRWIGVPQYLQMDNALEFRGSIRYPRSFGRVVRVAVDLGIEPLFNPTSEPWRNGGVERHNGFLEAHLLTIDFADVAMLQREVHVCQDACNEFHRSATLNGLTPNEVVSQTPLRLLSPAYQRHHRSLTQNKGFVTFIRLVRKSGRITLGAGDRFMVDPDLASTYVVARVDLARQLVAISQQLDEKLLRIYDYSADTVGKWATDDDVNETLKEQHCNANSCTSEH